MRGVSPNGIFADEMSSYQHNFFKNILAPLLSVFGRTFYGMSTLSPDPSSLWSVMLRSGAWEVYRVSYICEECTKMGVFEICSHNIHFVPPWILKDDGISELMYGKGDDIVNRERFGVEMESNPYCFPEMLVARVFSQPRFTPFNPVRTVYVAIDPDGGTDDHQNATSHFCLVAISEPDSTIVSLESFPTSTFWDYKDRLKENLGKIRKIPGYSNCVFIIDLEGQLGHTAGYIQHQVLLEFNDVKFVHDFERKVGTVTSKNKKMDMMNITYERLENNKVNILSSWVTTEKNPQTLLNLLREQLSAYKREVVKSKNEKEGTSIRLTGKGENGKKLDDLAVTLQRALRLQFEVNIPGYFRNKKNGG